MPDPKLKLAMEEILTVLRKHDIAGTVFLASPTHTEFLAQMDTTWTCFKHEGSVLRMRALARDFPEPGRQKEIIERSLGTLLGFVTTMGHVSDGLSGLVKEVATKVGEIQHFDRREG